MNLISQMKEDYEYFPTHSAQLCSVLVGWCSHPATCLNFSSIFHSTVCAVANRHRRYDMSECLSSSHSKQIGHGTFTYIDSYIGTRQRHINRTGVISEVFVPLFAIKYHHFASYLIRLHYPFYSVCLYNIRH